MKSNGIKTISLLLFVAVFFPSCSWQSAFTESGFTRAELVFGLSKPDGSTVSPQEWTDFLEQSIAPRFRQGFTVVDASGSWTFESGKTEIENSKIVIIVYKGDEVMAQNIDAILHEYKTRFSQEAVLKILIPASVGF